MLDVSQASPAPGLSSSISLTMSTTVFPNLVSVGSDIQTRTIRSQPFLHQNTPVHYHLVDPLLTESSTGKLLPQKLLEQ